MNKFHTRLVNLLKQDARFTDENGELIYAALVNHADKMDRELVKTLLRDKEIKEAFFKEIEGHWIFDAKVYRLCRRQKFPGQLLHALPQQDRTQHRREVSERAGRSDACVAV